MRVLYLAYYYVACVQFLNLHAVGSRTCMVWKSFIVNKVELSVCLRELIKQLQLESVFRFSLKI